MFDAPPRITAEIAFRLPASLSRAGDTAPWLRLHRNGAPLGSFLEGPSFDQDGHLYVVDIPFGRVFRIAPDGHFDVVIQYDGQPNGLKFGPDGAAWISDFARGLLRLEPSSGRIETVLDAREHGFHGLNDLYFHGDECWFTDQGMSGLQAPFGRVMRWRIGGRAPEVFLDGIPSPNGIVVDQAGRHVLIAVTRANAIWGPRSCSMAARPRSASSSRCRAAPARTGWRSMCSAIWLLPIPVWAPPGCSAIVVSPCCGSIRR